MQGVVYWQPPESAMAKVEKIIREPTLSKYGSDDGLPELREALFEKVTSFYLEYIICFVHTLNQEGHCHSELKVLLLTHYIVTKF
jgi:hypothetical protein